MKLIRFVKDGKEKIGILEGTTINEISIPMIQALNSENLSNLQKKSYKLSQVQIKPPVSPSKIICIGLNYKDHAEELNMEIPEEPIIFMKPPTSVIAHHEKIIYPEKVTQLDYEAEMAVVISNKAHHVKDDDANNYIGGFTVLNDVTARDLQRKDIQWTRAKSFNTFCPLGPCIETEMDHSNQKISLNLNHQLKQNSNTKNMIFSVERLIEFISHIMTLMPGDIIATGTPPGVGPMNKDDVVQAEVENIGILENRVI